MKLVSAELVLRIELNGRCVKVVLVALYDVIYRVSAHDPLIRLDRLIPVPAGSITPSSINWLTVASQ